MGNIKIFGKTKIEGKTVLIQAGGLYSQGFGLLDNDLFAQVEVISMEEASNLLPVSLEEI
jgi:hypothetical protein